MAEGKHLVGDVIIDAIPSIITMAGAELINYCREQLLCVRPRLLEGYSAYLQNWCSPLQSTSRWSMGSRLMVQG
jgi:LysR family transcriptional regulator, nitrogen assimilation regulatory protein